MTVITSLRPVRQFVTKEHMRAILGWFITVIGAIMYGVGWIPAKTSRALWIAGLWSLSAIKLGWKDGLVSGPTR